MAKLIRIFILTLMVISVNSCSSRGDFCLFGYTDSEFPDYDKEYWRSVVKNKSKASKSDLEKCNQETENTRVIMVNIFTELCSSGHISQENLPNAIAIQHNYLEDHFRSRPKNLIGTTDQIFLRLLGENIENKPLNADLLHKACARYIPQNNIRYHYQGIGPDSQFFYYFNKYHFQQCMRRNNFELITPKKTERWCKGVMW